MRLIDADDFKEKIKGVCDAGGWLEPVTTAIKEYICKQVDYQTPVDAVEVVRCKNCKHWNTELTKVFMCYCPMEDRWTGDDYYCASGERKEEEK